jgi:hypothetical protein
MITLGPSLTGLRGTEVTGSIIYTLVTNIDSTNKIKYNIEFKDKSNLIIVTPQTNSTSIEQSSTYKLLPPIGNKCWGVSTNFVLS